MKMETHMDTTGRSMAIARSILSVVATDGPVATEAPYRMKRSIACSFEPDEYPEDFEFEPGRLPNIIAGLLAGAGFLEATYNEFKKGDVDPSTLTPGTLLRGALDGFCPPSLAAAYYVCAAVHPLWGIRVQRNGNEEFSRVTREFFKDMISGDVGTAVSTYRSKVEGIPYQEIPYLIGDINKNMLEALDREPAHKVVRCLYAASRHE